jgi:TPR repeat protein
MAWSSGNFSRAYSVVAPRAERGEPWAQLRLGIFYENAWGVDQDYKKAEYWYKKAAAQKASGDWANGQLVGAAGKAGFFNQNSDALIAEYNLADMYFNGRDGIEKDFITAYVLINNVLKVSNGQSVFFCCEFSGGRYFSQEQFTSLRDKTKAKMSSEQLKQANEIINKNGS